MKYLKIKNKICKIVKNATKIYFNKPFYEKTELHKFADDDVTNLDILTQNYLIGRLKKIIPNSGFLGEENNCSDTENKEYIWVIDPIDGTFNFKHKIELFGTQLALIKNNKTIMSILYLPANKKMYFADESGAYMNNKKINVSQNIDLNLMAVAVGDYVRVLDLVLQKQIASSLADNVKRVRMFGSSCFDYCEVASGSTDVHIIYSKNKWDLLPGQFLAKQAGGYVYENENLNMFITGNKANVDNIVKLLKI